MRADPEEFQGFALGHAAQLQRIAYLLCGDAEAAREVVDAALALTWRRWREVEEGERPEVLALRSVARAALRARTAPQPVEVDAEDLEAARRDEFWNALSTLPSRERVALVLANLPEEVAPVPVDAAELLGRRRLAQWHASAMERLVLTGVECPAELVHDTLAERADVRQGDLSSPDNAFRLQRGRTRRSLLLLSGGAVIAAAGTAFGLSRRGGEGQAPLLQPTPTPAVPLPGRVQLTPPLPWPPRGNLVTDAAVMTGLRVSFASTYRSVVGGIQVIYAADLPSARFALVAGRDGRGDSIFAWFYGPPGTPADELRSWIGIPDWMVLQMRREPAVLAVGIESGIGFLVWLGAPGLETAQVSWGPSYNSDGTVYREFETLALDDGIAAIDLVGRSWRWVQMRPEVHEGIGASLPTLAGNVAALSQLPAQQWQVELELPASWDGSAVWFTSQVSGLVPITSADDVKMRAIWASSDGYEPAAVMRVTRHAGGEFLVASRAGMATARSIPAATPDFPAAWTEWFGGDGLSLWIVPGPGSARVELVQRGEIVAAQDVKELALNLIEVPGISTEVQPPLGLKVRDAHGSVLWSGPLRTLIGYDVDVYE